MWMFKPEASCKLHFDKFQVFVFLWKASELISGLYVTEHIISVVILREPRTGREGNPFKALSELQHCHKFIYQLINISGYTAGGAVCLELH